MKPLLTATYFPFTTISPSLVEALSSFLDRLVVFQPVGIEPADTLLPWVDQGFLDVRPFSVEPSDEKALMAELQDWKAWGHMHQREDLSYLKHVPGGIASAGPIVPTVVSEIKGAGGGNQKGALENLDFVCQRFLHLAHDFDRQSIELETQLAQVKKQKDSLVAFFRTDGQSAEDGPTPGDPFVDVHQDPGAFMTGNRIKAWKHLFRKEGAPPDATIFVTDSPAARDALLEPVEEAVEIARFTMAGPGASSDSSGPPGQSPYKDPIRKLFHTLVTTQWDNTTRKDTEKTIGRIADIASNDPNATSRASQTAISSQWHLLPGMAAATLLDPNHQPSLETGAITPPPVNILVGLLESPCRSEKSPKKP